MLWGKIVWNIIINLDGLSSYVIGLKNIISFPGLILMWNAAGNNDYLCTDIYLKFDW